MELRVNAEIDLCCFPHRCRRRPHRAPRRRRHKQDRTCHRLIIPLSSLNMSRPQNPPFLSPDHHNNSNKTPAGKARPAPCSIRFDQASSAQRAGRWGSKSAHLCLTCSGRDVLRAADRCWEPTNDDEDTTKACAGASSATAVATEAVTFMTIAVVFVEKRRERGVCRMLAAGTLLGQSEGPLIATKFSIRGGGHSRAAHALFFAPLFSPPLR